jgi:hypothetical protein
MSPPAFPPASSPPQSAAQQAHEEMLAMQEWFEGGYEAEEREEEAHWFPDLGGNVCEAAAPSSAPVRVKRQGCVHSACSSCGGIAVEGSCECAWTCACEDCRALR